jgi:hypothetical protein
MKCIPTDIGSGKVKWMDADKRKILVGEIEQWRRSKLLPEQYCDFLLNLYGDEQSRKSASKVFGVSIGAIQNGRPWMWTLFLVGLLMGMFVVVNFNSFGIVLQIALSVSFVVCLYMIGLLMNRKSKMAGMLFISLGCLFALFIGLYLLRQHGVEMKGYYALYIGLIGLLWLIVGLIGSSAIIQYCGWIALACVYSYLLSQRIDDSAWYILQLCWLPIAIIFVWVGWLLHRKNKSTSRVLLFTGLTLAFMPEISSLFASADIRSAMMQGLLFAKLSIAVMLLFALRNKWTEWIV